MQVKQQIQLELDHLQVLGHRLFLVCVLSNQLQQLDFFEHLQVNQSKVVQEQQFMEELLVLDEEHEEHLVFH
jgi:hypothetical protein